MLQEVPKEEHKPMTYRVAVLATLLDMKGEPTTCSAIAKRRGFNVKATGTILSKLKKEGHAVKTASAGRTNGVSYEAKWIHGDFATPEQRAEGLKLGNRGPKERKGITKGADGKPLAPLVAEAMPIILRFLTKQTMPIGASTMSNMLGFPKHRIRLALKQLHIQDKITRSGQGMSIKYAIAKPTLVTEPDEIIIHVTPPPQAPVPEPIPRQTPPPEHEITIEVVPEDEPDTRNPHAAANMSVVARMDQLQADLETQLAEVASNLDALRTTRKLLGL